MLKCGTHERCISQCGYVWCLTCAVVTLLPHSFLPARKNSFGSWCTTFKLCRRLCCLTQWTLKYSHQQFTPLTVMAACTQKMLCIPTFDLSALMRVLSWIMSMLGQLTDSYQNLGAFCLSGPVVLL